MLKYYIPDHGEGPEDARELKPRFEHRRVPEDPEHFVEEAAEYCQSHRDGWEWSWPVVFVVLNGDTEAGRFEVHREFEPTFSASVTAKTDEQCR